MIEVTNTHVKMQYRRLKHGTNQVFYNIVQKILLSSFYLVSVNIYKKWTTYNFTFIMFLHEFFFKNNYLIAWRTFEQTADFFRGDNKEGVEARNEVSELLLLLWFFSHCVLLN
jgi:hypothetical protein